MSEETVNNFCRLRTALFEVALFGVTTVTSIISGRMSEISGSKMSGFWSLTVVYQ